MKTTLKRFFILATMLAILLNFVGCSSYKFNEEKVGADMEEKLTQLFISVQNGDKETFKTFFAEHVISLSHFEAGCNYVFDTFHGDLIDVTFHSAGHTGKEIVPGEQICYAYMTFRVTTSKEEYEVCVEFYTQYESKYPNNSYKIRQFSLFPKQKDGNFIPKEIDGNFSRDWIAFGYGIYYPGWQNDDVK